MYSGIEIKQYFKVTYLGCLRDETMCGELMALKIIKRINQKLKFLFRKNGFLIPRLRRFLCNAIIQPHFDYACSTWYPNFTQKLKKKLKVRQNKCVRFCLQLDKMFTISHKEFKDLNWLPAITRFEQSQWCLNLSMVIVRTTWMKFSNLSPKVMLNDLFEIQTQVKKLYLLLVLRFIGIKSQRY